MPVRRALVYGDVDLNLLDGSAIWAVGVVETFARAGCDVTLLLKARVITDRLIAPLARLSNVTVVRPFESGLAGSAANDRLDRRTAVGIMASLDAETPYDLVVARGFGLLTELAAAGRFAGRLWTYLTDVPQSITQVTADSAERLAAIARASHYLLCQTEELRSFIETTVPDAVGRCVLFPPGLPDDTVLDVHQRDAAGPLKLVYAGKFAALWKTEAMTRLPAQLGALGIPVELHAIGDKIHSEREDPGFAERMEVALRSAAGVIWHGGLSREATLGIASTCDVGLGWRDRRLDGSLELSTKVLEYGALGLPVILNRTPMHERLLGDDYPLFANEVDEVVEAVASATDEATYRTAAERCRAVASAYAQHRAVARARMLLDQAFPAHPVFANRARPLRVVVAGHDFKFISRLIERFSAYESMEVRVDEWPGRNRHDPAYSAELCAWADVVVCEWCGPNAIWYAEHKRPGQRLYVRLHRFELYRDWPARLAIDRVDRVVCVSPHYAGLTLEMTGWPQGRVGVIPNWVDAFQLDRPKLPNARFHLGMIGVGERRKRLDLALDVLAKVRRQDRRFHLFAKTKLPWEYPGVWKMPGEAEHARAVMARVQNDPLLRGAVVFDAFGPDVATWLRRIGQVLSTSDDESFHLAPAEGMASRAVPVIRAWPGADTTYSPRWVHAQPDAMAAAILETGADDDRWSTQGEDARAEIVQRYSLDRVVEAWIELIAGGTNT